MILIYIIEVHSWQVGRSKLQVIVTFNGKNGRALCNKTFSVRNSWISPWIPDFSGFVCSMLLRVISGFRKTKIYKILLRIVGGDSKNRNLCNNTHNLHNLILIGFIFSLSASASVSAVSAVSASICLRQRLRTEIYIYLSFANLWSDGVDKIESSNWLEYFLTAFP